MSLTLDSISKRYGAVTVLEGLTLSVAGGKITTLLGPSGCGKTTLLNIISRVELPDSGKIHFQSENVSLGYMPQESLLLPWRSLRENARLGAEIAGTHADTEDAIQQYFAAFDIEGFLDIYPDSSSGGMKQRVALIRTLLPRPTFLLFDEPFSNLDFDIKLKVQKHLLDYHNCNAATTLLVTHDIEDAIAMSDTVVIFSERPAAVKAVLHIDLGIPAHNPVAARKSPRFRDYFAQIWDHLKYLEVDDGN
jgi:NitT/TauT family transport system ATP-binding protein